MPARAPRNKTEFARRLRALRLARGFDKAKAFATAIGVQQNTYTRYERGEAEPNIETLQRIWIALDQPACSLFGDVPIAPAGFAETAPLPMAPTPPAAVANAAIARRDALAWKLAEIGADLATARTLPRPTRLDRLRRVAVRFESLKSDPFAAASHLIAEAERASLGAGAQQSLAAAADAFLAVASELALTIPEGAASSAATPAPLSRESRPRSPPPRPR